MEVANPQRMGDTAPLVNPARVCSNDNLSRSPRASIQHPTPSLTQPQRLSKTRNTSQSSPEPTELHTDRGLPINFCGPRRPQRTKQERVMGIEPTPPAWKAGALPLSYTRLQSTHFAKWREQDSNLRRQCHQIYSLAPLATRVSRQFQMSAARPEHPTPRRATADLA